MSAVSIRLDRTPTVLRKLAKGESAARIARRILAIANAPDGGRRRRSRQAGPPNAARLGHLLQRARSRWARRPVA
jgi:hypothetical protein